MLKQGEFAKRLRITQSYFSAIERGHKRITVELLEILFKEVGVSPIWYYYFQGPIIINTEFSESADKEVLPVIIANPRRSFDQPNSEIREILKRLEEVESQLKSRNNQEATEGKGLQFYTHADRLADEKKERLKSKKERPT